MMRRLYLLMAPVYLTTGLTLALFLVPGLAVAGPTLSGSYRAEAYGTVELTTQGDHVSGRFTGNGGCRFPPQTEVLVGDFEGSVLVARLTLCQTGDLCPGEQSYTVLGFYNEAGNTLVAYVKLSQGCTSNAVQQTNGSWRFMLVPADKQGAAPGADSASGAASDPGRGASAQEAARQASKRGNVLYQQGEWTKALAQFRQSLEYDSSDANWPAYMGKGSCLLKLGQVAQGIKDLERARSANPQDGPLLYLLAGAYAQMRDKKVALQLLRSAVKVGYPLHTSVEGDADLLRALGTEPQFKELVKTSREKSARGAAGSGTSSP